MDRSAEVEERAAVVSLMLVAMGAEVGAAFTVQVDTREAVPLSAKGGRAEWVGQGWWDLVCFFSLIELMT